MSTKILVFSGIAFFILLSACTGEKEPGSRRAYVEFSPPISIEEAVSFLQSHQAKTYTFTLGTVVYGDLTPKEMRRRSGKGESHIRLDSSLKAEGVELYFVKRNRFFTENKDSLLLKAAQEVDKHQMVLTALLNRSREELEEQAKEDRKHWGGIPYSSVRLARAHRDLDTAESLQEILKRRTNVDDESYLKSIKILGMGIIIDRTLSINENPPVWQVRWLPTGY